MQEILDGIKQTGAKRLVIDSLVGFEMALLRMLAFRPLAPTAVATQSLPAVTVSPARASPKQTQPTPQPADPRRDGRL